MHMPYFTFLRYARFLFFAVIFAILLCISTLSNPTTTFAQEEGGDAEIGNLLVNRGFELGDHLSPWAKYGNGTLVAQNCCAHAGYWSAKLTTSNNNYVEIYQSVYVTPGQRYRLIVWVYTSGTTATLGWFANVGGDRDCASSNSTGYVKLQCEFIVPAGTTSFNAHLWIRPSGTGYAVVDSWRLQAFCTGPFCYAQWSKFGAFNGVWAIIETPVPQVREGVHSYMTINVHKSNPQMYVEAGVLRGPPTGCVPKFSWAIQPGSAQVIEDPNKRPVPGTAYQYYIFKIAQDTWKLWIARLDGTIIVDQNIPNPGFNQGDRLSAGGETHSPNHLNDIGVSGVLSLKWMNPQSQWIPWSGKDLVHQDRPYKVVEINPFDGNNIQASGNNGNPMPPNAPCP